MHHDSDLQQVDQRVYVLRTSAQSGLQNVLQLCPRINIITHFPQRALYFRVSNENFCGGFDTYPHLIHNFCVKCFGFDNIYCFLLQTNKKIYFFYLSQSWAKRNIIASCALCAQGTARSEQKTYSPILQNFCFAKIFGEKFSKTQILRNTASIPVSTKQKHRALCAQGAARGAKFIF